MRRETLALVALTTAVLLSTAWAGQKIMSVQVRQGPVRATPSFIGQVVGSLNYGDRVQVTEEKPGWTKVSAGAVSGWMHTSSLTEKRVVLAAGGGTVQTGASSEEVALAGKGFNADVEAQFRAQNRSANFTAVDRMEKRAVTQQEMMKFLRAGGVSPREGGAR
jgi:SH3-like domain-containing protein